jgi:hypothetical protein
VKEMGSIVFMQQEQFPNAIEGRFQRGLRNANQGGYGTPSSEKHHSIGCANIDANPATIYPSREVLA